MLLSWHLRQMTERLRNIPEDRWEWQIEPSAPSAKMLGEHCYSWLVCDRQHIQESDVHKHDLIPVPASQSELCDALNEEAEVWRNLISSLTPEQMSEPRFQFGEREMNIRGFVGHIMQNSIYKNGQLSTIYFALGLDGTEQYDAPLPNRMYTRLKNGEKV